MQDLNKSGMIVIGVIICILIYGMWKSLKINLYYKGLMKEFTQKEKEYKESRCENFNFLLSDECMKLSFEEFKTYAENGVHNINTEVIIQKNTKEGIIGAEKIVGILPATSIAFGLIGTFLGLVGSIAKVGDVLNGEIASINQFTEKLAPVMTNMSSAFWTSIVGVIVSLMVTFIYTQAKVKKDRFYDTFEDYLDNKVFDKYIKTEMKEFNLVVEKSMTTLVTDMNELFNEGIKTLVEGVNTNTENLNESAKELRDHVKDLNRVTDSLNDSVENFKNPVDKFAVSISEQVNSNEEFILSVNGSVSKFAEKVDKLEVIMTLLNQGVEGNKQELSSLASHVKIQGEKISDSYNIFRTSVSDMKSYEEEKNKLMIVQIENLNNGYKQFGSGLNEFMENLKMLETSLGKGVSESLNKEMKNMTDGIVSELSKYLEEMKDATEQLSSNSLNVAELTKATNEWISVVKEDNKIMSLVGATTDEV